MPTPSAREQQLERENAVLRSALTVLAERSQQLWYDATAALTVADTNGSVSP